jgi:hypothetical protein
MTFRSLATHFLRPEKVSRTGRDHEDPRSQIRLRCDDLVSLEIHKIKKDNDGGTSRSQYLLSCNANKQI